MPKNTIPAPAKVFVKKTAHKTWGTALWVALLFGGIALAVSSFQGPPAGCTPTNCPANPLKVDFINGKVKIGEGLAAGQNRLEVAGGIKANGGIQVANDSTACTGTNAGTIRWTGAEFQGCSGTGWAKLNGGGSSGSSSPYCAFKGKSTSVSAPSGLRIATFSVNSTSLTPTIALEGFCFSTANSTSTSCTYGNDIINKLSASFNLSTGILTCSQSVGGLPEGILGTATITPDPTLCP